MISMWSCLQLNCESRCLLDVFFSLSYPWYFWSNEDSLLPKQNYRFGVLLHYWCHFLFKLYRCVCSSQFMMLPSKDKKFDQVIKMLSWLAGQAPIVAHIISKLIQTCATNGHHSFMTLQPATTLKVHRNRTSRLLIKALLNEHDG